MGATQGRARGSSRLPKNHPSLSKGAVSVQRCWDGVLPVGCGVSLPAWWGGSASPQPLFAITRELLLVPSPGVSVLHSPPEIPRRAHESSHIFGLWFPREENIFTA